VLGKRAERFHTCDAKLKQFSLCVQSQKTAEKRSTLEKRVKAPHRSERPGNRHSDDLVFLFPGSGHRVSIPQPSIVLSQNPTADSVFSGSVNILERAVGSAGPADPTVESAHSMP
jgi:hypothetical protein